MRKRNKNEQLWKLKINNDCVVELLNGITTKSVHHYDNKLNCKEIFNFVCFSLVVLVSAKTSKIKTRKETIIQIHNCQLQFMLEACKRKQCRDREITIINKFHHKIKREQKKKNVRTLPLSALKMARTKYQLNKCIEIN